MIWSHLLYIEFNTTQKRDIDWYYQSFHHSSSLNSSTRWLIPEPMAASSRALCQSHIHQTSNPDWFASINDTDQGCLISSRGAANFEFLMCRGALGTSVISYIWLIVKICWAPICKERLFPYSCLRPISSLEFSWMLQHFAPPKSLKGIYQHN